MAIVKIKLEIILDYETDNENISDLEIEEMIEELDYDFCYPQFTGDNKIVNTEIRDFERIKII